MGLGLVSEVVDPEHMLDSTVEDITAQVLDNSPAAVRGAKKLVLDIANRPIDDTLIEQTSELIARIRVSSEGQEGLAAFLNKREPAWK